MQPYSDAVPSSPLAWNIRLFVPYKLLMGLCGCGFPCSLLVYHRSGMSNGEIAYLQAIFGVIFAPLLIAGGYIADRTGRKRALLLGTILFGVGWAIYGSVSSFSALVVAEIILAVALGLTVGAEHALIFDSLLALGREAEHPSIRGSAFAASSFMTGIGALAGSYLANFNLGLPFYIGSFGCVVGSILLSFMSEPPMASAPRQHLIYDLKRVFHSAFTSDWEVRRIVVGGAAVVGVSMAGYPLLQVCYTEMGIGPAWFGFIILTLNWCAAFGMRYTKRIQSALGGDSSFLLIILLYGASFVALGSAPVGIALIFAAVMFWVRGFQDAVLPDLLNPRIGSLDRSAMNALVYAIGRLVQAVLLLPVGQIANSASARSALLSLSALAIGVAGVWSRKTIRAFAKG